MDTEALDAKLAALAAEGLQADDYTSASWSAYTAALDAPPESDPPNTTAYPSAETAQAAQDAIDAAPLCPEHRLCRAGEGGREESLLPSTVWMVAATVSAADTMRVERGSPRFITAPAIANFTATGMTSITQTGRQTARSPLPTSSLPPATPSPSVLDYQRSSHWLNGVTSRGVTVAEAYGAGREWKLLTAPDNRHLLHLWRYGLLEVCASGLRPQADF